MAAPFGNLDAVVIAQNGDLISFRRTFYHKHWAVYIGDRNTIGVSSPDENYFSTIEMKDVSELCSTPPCQGHCCCVNNLEEVARRKRLETYKNDIIVQRALERYQEKFKYSLRFRNCEHFATACRYNRPFSTQVERYSKYLPFIMIRLRRDNDVLENLTKHASKFASTENPILS